MTRIQPNTTPDAKSQEMLANIKKAFGMVPNVFKTMAQSSAVLDFYLSGAGALGSTKITPALREQLAVAVAGLNSCDYCASAHTLLGKMQRVPESEIALNLQGKSADLKTQAALDFAQKIVNLRGHVTDGDVQAIRKAGYNDGEIVEIIAVVAQNIFTNYFNHITGAVNDFPLVRTPGVAAEV